VYVLTVPEDYILYRFLVASKLRLICTSSQSSTSSCFLEARFVIKELIVRLVTILGWDVAVPLLFLVTLSKP